MGTCSAYVYPAESTQSCEHAMKDFYVCDAAQHENKLITSSFVVAVKQVVLLSHRQRSRVLVARVVW